MTGLLQVTRAEGDPGALRREPVRLDQLLEEIVADSIARGARAQPRRAADGGATGRRTG